MFLHILNVLSVLYSTDSLYNNNDNDNDNETILLRYKQIKIML